MVANSLLACCSAGGACRTLQASSCLVQAGEFTTVVMKLDAGAGQVYSRNDMLLLSRDDPQVRLTCPCRFVTNHVVVSYIYQLDVLVCTVPCQAALLQALAACAGFRRFRAGRVPCTLDPEGV